MTVVSRQTLVASRFPTVVCAPLFTRGHGLETEVSVGPEDGLKHPSWIASDGLVSIPKSRLTDFVGSLSPEKLWRLSGLAQGERSPAINVNSFEARPPARKRTALLCASRPYVSSYISDRILGRLRWLSLYSQWAHG